MLKDRMAINLNLLFMNQMSHTFATTRRQIPLPTRRLNVPISPPQKTYIYL